MKLSTAKTKTVQGSLTLCASNIEGNDWYRQLLHKYILELPKLQVWLPKVDTFREMLGSVNDMDMASGLPVLSGIAKELHQITQALSSECIAAFISAYLNKVKAVYTHICENIATIPLSTIVELQSVYAELVITWPMDADLNSQAGELANCLASAKRAHTADRVAESAQAVVTMLSNTEGLSADEAWKAITAMKMQSEGLTPGKCSDEEKSKAIQDAWHLSLQFLAVEHCSPSSVSDGKDIPGMLNTLKQFPELLGFASSKNKAIFTCFEALFGLHTKYQEAFTSSSQEVLGVLKKQNPHATLQGLKRAHMQFKAAEKNLPSKGELPNLLKDGLAMMDKMESIAANSVNTVVTHMESSASDEVSAMKSRLSYIGGGCENGSAWTDQLTDKSSWKSLEQLWKDGVLFTIKALNLVDAIAALEEAFGINMHR
eukprot:4526983-Amphidinium_carterae.2